MHIGDEIVCRGVIVGYSRNSGGLIRVDFPAHKNVSIYRDMITEVVSPPWKPAVGDQYELYYQTYKIIYIHSKWIVVMNINEAYAPLVLTRATFLDGKRIKIN